MWNKKDINLWLLFFLFSLFYYIVYILLGHFIDLCNSFWTTFVYRWKGTIYLYGVWAKTKGNMLTTDIENKNYRIYMRNTNKILRYVSIAPGTV